MRTARIAGQACAAAGPQHRLNLEEVDVVADIQVGGLLYELREFGPTSRDSGVFLPDGSSLPPDGIATQAKSPLPPTESPHRQEGIGNCALPKAKRSKDQC